MRGKESTANFRHKIAGRRLGAHLGLHRNVVVVLDEKVDRDSGRSLLVPINSNKSSDESR